MNAVTLNLWPRRWGALEPFHPEGGFDFRLAYGPFVRPISWPWQTNPWKEKHMHTILTCTAVLISVPDWDSLPAALEYVRKNAVWLAQSFPPECKERELLRIEVGGEVVLRIPVR